MDPNGQYYVATANGRDINNLQIGVKFTGEDEPTNQTDLFNIQDWPNNSGDTINSITVYARWKNSGAGAAVQKMRCTQVYVSVDYTAVSTEQTLLKLKSGSLILKGGTLIIK